MAMAQALTPEAEQQVIAIIRQDLTEGLGDDIIFDPILVEATEDPFGNPYHHVTIVHSGDGDRLDSAWLNGLKRRNWKKLEPLGLTIFAESYIEAEEYAELLEYLQAGCPEDDERWQ